MRHRSSTLIARRKEQRESDLRRLRPLQVDAERRGILSGHARDARVDGGTGIRGVDRSKGD